MSAENPADTVIEAVALAIGKHRRGSQEAWDEDRRLARALHDAGLLADPADRDVKARLIAHRNVLRRMDRAEAEVARLNDELIHVREVAELAEKDRRTYHRDALRAEAEVAELRATVERCKALADEWERALSDTLRVEIDELRAALDPDGGAS